MAEARLTVRSSKARDMAHRLALRRDCTIKEVVERALEAYAERESEREPAAEFCKRISAEYGADIELDA